MQGGRLKMVMWVNGYHVETADMTGGPVATVF